MVTDLTNNPEKKKIHPHKMFLWAGLGSIVMMFAGLTSAHIVKKGQANWLEFEMPSMFIASTVVILLSSFTIQMALKKYKEQNANAYRGFMAVTAILGVVFMILQIQGFMALNANSIALIGPRSNSAASFLFVIVSLHLLHVLGGVIALIGVSFGSFSAKNKLNNSLPVELVSTYWHFVDILWIYLIIFLYWLG
jgi:cytochrome c oxidase subunit 3